MLVTGQTFEAEIGKIFSVFQQRYSTKYKENVVCVAGTEKGRGERGMHLALIPPTPLPFRHLLAA